LTLTRWRGRTLQVHENEPVGRLDGVVRSGDRKDDVVGKRGTIKNIAGRFSSLQARDASEDSSSSSSSEDEDPRRRRPAPLRRSQTTTTAAPAATRRDHAPAARRDHAGTSDVLSENVPAELDPSVVRSTEDYRANDPVMQSGHIRNVAERWRQQQEQDANPTLEPGRRSSKPAWLIELENAKESEYGVFENEPEVYATD